MKRISLTILALSAVITGCSNSNSPSIKDIELKVSQSLKNQCEYVIASNFKKINGYEEKDRNGNPEYIVEFKYDLTLKATDAWTSDYDRWNREIADADKSVKNFLKELERIVHDAEKYVDNAKKSEPYSTYRELLDRDKNIYIDVSKTYYTSLKTLAEEFIEKNKKWDSIFEFGEVSMMPVDVSLSLPRHVVPEEYEMRGIKIPGRVKEKITEIPTACVGRDERGGKLDTPLIFFEKEFLYLTKLKPRGYEPEKAKLFIKGDTKEITVKSTMRKTEKGWFFK
ncbi:hypothetical protein [Eoetvoesiella caeni]